MNRKCVPAFILSAFMLALLSYPHIIAGFTNNPLSMLGTKSLAESAQATPPEITSARLKGKKLTVTGTNFAPRAVILINGIAQKTKNTAGAADVSLIAKKAGKSLIADDIVILQVQNPDGLLSSELSFHTGCSIR